MSIRPSDRESSSSTNRRPFSPTRSQSVALSFDLNTFASKDFVVKDFIEKLSDESDSRRRSEHSSTQIEFDPKPAIRTFEAVRIQLRKLSEELSEHETQLEAGVKLAELNHTATTKNIQPKLDKYADKLRALDTTLNGEGNLAHGENGEQDAGRLEGNVALRIGERLEELERQRQRIQNTKRLINCWLDVSQKGSIGILEDMQRSGHDGMVKSAGLARQLLKIASAFDSNDMQQQANGQQAVAAAANIKTRSKSVFRPLETNTVAARELIERFLEVLEKSLLKQFDKHYRSQNYNGMKECAAALRDFNDGASVAAMFVNQHTFFIDRSQILAQEIMDTDSWDRIADPDAEPPGVEPGLQAIIDEVKIIMQQESEVIKRAFPAPEEILNIFLTRIFQQSIQARLELVLDKADAISSLAFLRALQASRSYISVLVEDFKAHGLTQHPDDTVSPQVSANLDQQLEDLFTTYLSGSSYIDREKKNLDELYSSLLFKFTTYHAKRKKAPATYLDLISQRGAQILQSARDASIDRLDSSDLSVSYKAILIRLAGLKDSDNTNAKAEIEVTEEDGEVNIEFAKRMIRWLAEGVRRSLEFSCGNDSSRDIQALTSVLLTQMGEVYLHNALLATSDLALAQESSKSEPDISYFQSLRGIAHILHLLQNTTDMLLPTTKSNPTIHQSITKLANTTINSLEMKISELANRTLDISLAWTSKLLANQKKTDFRPKVDSKTHEEDFALVTQTPTCLAVYTFLTRVASHAMKTLDGKNLSSFLSDLAMGLREQLDEHLRKFTISLAGSIVVSRDLNQFADMVRSWQLAGTPFGQSAGMVHLTQKAQLFVIGPEALRERLKAAASRSHGELVNLRRFVERREDAGSNEIQAVLSAI